MVIHFSLCFRFFRLKIYICNTFCLFLFSILLSEGFVQGSVSADSASDTQTELWEVYSLPDPISNTHPQTQLFEILSIDPISLGKGGNGEVFKVEVAPPGHPELRQSKAMKIFSLNPVLEKHLIEVEKLLHPLQGKKGLQYLHLQRTDLTAELKTFRPGKFHIALSDLSQGSVDTKLNYLNLLKVAPDQFESRVSLLNHLSDQVVRGLRFLSENHLVHSDIKPSNIFFQIDSDFNWEKPDSNKIQFKLADFDTLSKSGDTIIGFTPFYTPPEIIRSQNAAKAHTGFDLYSFSTTLYKSIFGNYPVIDYIQSQKFSLIRKDNTSNSMLEIQAEIFNSKDGYYQFHNWARDKLNSFEASIQNPELRTKVHRLMQLTLSGLSYDPEDRLKVFEIDKHLRPFHLLASSSTVSKKEKIELVHSASPPSTISPSDPTYVIPFAELDTELWIPGDSGLPPGSSRLKQFSSYDPCSKLLEGLFLHHFIFHKK